MTAVAAPPEPKLNPLALPALAAAYFTLGISTMAPIGLIPEMSHDLQVTPGAIAFLLTALAFTYTLIALPLQMAFGDWDRKTLVLIGVGGVAVGQVICAIAPNYAVAVFSRMVMAFGCSLIGPMVNAAAASIVPPHRAGQAVGFVLIGTSLSSVIGVPLASLMGQLVGWRYAMAGIAVLCVLIMAAVYYSVPAGSHGRKTTASAMLSTFKDPVLAPGLAVTFFQMAATFCTTALVGVFLIQYFHVPEHGVPLALLANGIAGIIGTSIAAHLLGRVGHDRLLRVTLPAVCVVFLILQFPPPPGVIAIALFLLWSIVGSTMMGPQGARLVALAGESRNMVLALNAALLQCGIAAGAALAGYLYDHFGVRSLPHASLAISLITLAMYWLSYTNWKRRNDAS
ncbi:MAG: MFS transporter [Hyphomonadaceae bacterium]